MKRLSALFLTVAMIVALSSGALAAPSQAESPVADPITMKLGLTFADSHLITKELYAMSDAVKKEPTAELRSKFMPTPY